MKTQVIVAALIFDKAGRLLLGKRADNGHWEVPGGKLEQGENIEQATYRELREETGLIASPNSLLPLTYFDCYKDNKHQLIMFGTVLNWCGEPKVMEADKCLCWDWWNVNHYDLPKFPEISLATVHLFGVLLENGCA